MHVQLTADLGFIFFYVFFKSTFSMFLFLLSYIEMLLCCVLFLKVLSKRLAGKSISDLPILCHL